jgi:hypothetical protein
MVARSFACANLGCIFLASSNGSLSPIYVIPRCTTHRVDFPHTNGT